MIFLNITKENYIALEEKLENALKLYLTFCFQGNLWPGKKLEKSEKPKISIIIPMYNEEKNVRNVVRKLITKFTKRRP